MLAETLNALLKRVTTLEQAQAVGQSVVTLTLEQVWEISSLHGEPFYGAITVVDNYVMAGPGGYTGKAVLFSGWDGRAYCVRADTGVELWHHDTGGNNYGRVTSADTNADGFNENYGSSHNGWIWAWDSRGGNLWQVKNAYERRGGNDGIPTTVGGVDYVGGSTAAGLVPTSYGVSNVKVSGAAFPANAWVRSTSISTFNAYVRVTNGASASSTLYPILKVDPLDHDNIILDTAAFPTTGVSNFQIIPKYVSDIYFQNGPTLAQIGGVWYGFTCGFDNWCIKIRLSDGVVTGEYATLSNIEAWPEVSDVDGDGVLECVFPSLDWNLRCLNASTFALKWTYTAPAGLDTVLTTVPLAANPAASLIIVGQARDGNPAAGRVVYLDGRDGSVISQSRDLEGNIDGKPLAIFTPIGEFDGCITANDAGLITRLDAGSNVVWQTHHDRDFFNSGCVRADLDGDGVNEILAFDAFGNGYVVAEDTGLQRALWYANGGYEGINYVGDILGNGHKQLVTSRIDGKVTMYNVIAA